MRNIALLFAILFSVLLVFGCISTTVSVPVPTTSSSGVTTTTNAIELFDCKTDLVCLIDLSRDCLPAKAAQVSKANQLGVLQTITYLLETRGMENNKCIFYVRTEKIDLNYSSNLVNKLLAENLTLEQIKTKEEEANKVVDAAEGTDGTCRLEATDLVTVLAKWKASAFSSDDLKDARCMGRMFAQQNANETNECTLSTPFPALALARGGRVILRVDGFKGSEERVSWSVLDPSVASVDFPSGASVNVVAQNPGVTKTTAVDNSVGPNCKVSVTITVNP
ncbi:hypothetical protein HY991_06170 [Candidatus Micrarchaeota archaeon]|nr:hypothetical protein [Candidatus Micrarchaeota archaeon]